MLGKRFNLRFVLYFLFQKKNQMLDFTFGDE